MGRFNAMRRSIRSFKIAPSSLRNSNFLHIDEALKPRCCRPFLLDRSFAKDLTLFVQIPHPLFTALGEDVEALNLLAQPCNVDGTLFP